jgi:hypothetical protein
MFETQSNKGAGVRYGSYAAGSLTASDIGKAVSINSSGTAVEGAADAVLRGRLEQITDDVATVAIGGLVEFDYSGSAPTVGTFVNWECAASGEIVEDATNGQPYFVEEVDTTNTKVVIDLK